MGAPSFIGVSLVIASLFSQPGCEIMVAPNLMLRKNLVVGCILFSPPASEQEAKEASDLCIESRESTRPFLEKDVDGVEQVDIVWG